MGLQSLGYAKKSKLLRYKDDYVKCRCTILGAKNTCCADGHGVSSNFIAVIRCSLNFFVALRCSESPHQSFLTVISAISAKTKYYLPRSKCSQNNNNCTPLLEDTDEALRAV